MKTVVHIMPTIPPTINGVGDFGYFLAEAMGEHADLNNIFLVKNLPDVKLNKVDKFDSQILADKLYQYKPQAIILHFVNYSFHSKGMPFYLLKSLKTIKALSDCKVMIYFHELYSSSNSMLKLSFYTNFLQKRIVKQLYDLADHTFTNCDQYQALLYKIVKDKNRNTVTGLFSNISDELYNDSVHKEDHTMVIFGSLTRRNKVYSNPNFQNLIKKLEIKEIYDIGSGQISVNSAEVTFHIKGALSVEDVAYYLNKAKFGGLDYRPHILGKSGILSAYAAFGVIPVNFNSEKESLLDGLKEDINYINSCSSFTQNNFQVMKQNVCNWYKPRNRNSIARLINNHL